MKRTKAMERAISFQVKTWESRKKSIEIPTEKGHLPFVTISREYGCAGYRVGEELAALLNKEGQPDPLWSVYDKGLLKQIMDDIGISKKLIETLTDHAHNEMTNFFHTTFATLPSGATVYHKLVETIRLLAANGRSIIIGRVGNMITRDFKKGFHVRIVASTEKKIDNLMTLYDIPKKEAESLVSKNISGREEYINRHIKIDITDPANYHLIINSSELTVEQTAAMIVGGMKAAGIL